MKKIIKRISLIVAALTLLSAFCIQAFAYVKETNTVAIGANEQNTREVVEVDDGLGEWRYGTGIGFSGLKPVKTAYSDLDHGSKTHRSSCEIDGNYVNSGWVPARTTSRSSTKGNDLESTAYCNWDVQ